jgi:hypothetical protein
MICYNFKKKSRIKAAMSFCAKHMYHSGAMYNLPIVCGALGEGEVTAIALKKLCLLVQKRDL